MYTHYTHSFTRRPVQLFLIIANSREQFLCDNCVQHTAEAKIRSEVDELINSILSLFVSSFVIIDFVIF